MYILYVVTVPVRSDPKCCRIARPRLAGWVTGETHSARVRVWQQNVHLRDFSRGAPQTGEDGEEGGMVARGSATGNIPKILCLCLSKSLQTYRHLYIRKKINVKTFCVLFLWSKLYLNARITGTCCTDLKCFLPAARSLLCMNGKTLFFCSNRTLL
jgi:hypothetical protein